MKPVVRNLTVTLPQIDVAIRLSMEGNGPLRTAIEALQPGSFGILMDGLKSDMMAYIHGSFRMQLMDVYTQLQTPRSNNPEIISYGIESSDNVSEFALKTSVTFYRLLSNEDMRDIAFKLTSCFFGNTSTSITRAQQNIARAAINETSQPLVAGTPQGIVTAADVRQQIQELQGQGAMAMSSAMGYAPDDQAPGQYL